MNEHMHMLACFLFSPACLYWVKTQVQYKSSTSVESHTAPDRVTPEFGLSLVLPGHEGAFSHIYIP